ncbi:uncharacterized protein LOC135930245 [Gordionus sp. m RMFG-2023]|uniref:uncharacterized protein LOC135930245 n=1 Tax=Gordionus sp. m RMFG-2023 TaxID=3053472 RepID=UPI0031FCE0C6
MWTDLSSRIDTAKSTLGLTRVGNKSYKELWWWNEEVQTTIKEKKALYKLWFKSKNSDNKTNYKKSKRIATTVARAKSMAYDDIRTLPMSKPCATITEQEIITCLKHMKNNKAMGPDDIQIESLKVLGDDGINLLTNLYN